MKTGGTTTLFHVQPELIDSQQWVKLEREANGKGGEKEKVIVVATAKLAFNTGILVSSFKKAFSINTLKSMYFTEL